MWGDVLNEFLSVSHNPDGTLNNSFINVKDYGALCDGVTDDTVAIAAALAAVVDAGGGTLYFPSGVCVGTVILDSISNINIEGSGWGSVLKIPSGTSYNAIQMTNCSNIRVSNLAIDGNKANVVPGIIYQCCSGVWISHGCSRITVENCYIHDCWGGGVETTGEAPNSTEDPTTYLWILNNYFDGIRDGTIFIRPLCSHILIQGNTCLNGNSYAIAVLYSTYVIATENYCENYNLDNIEGGAIQTGAASYCYFGNNILIAGASQYADTCNAVKLDETEETFNHGMITTSYCVVENNICQGYDAPGATAIYLPSSANCDIRGNLLIDCWGGFRVYKATDTTFEGNTISRNTTLGIFIDNNPNTKAMFITGNTIEGGSDALIALSSPAIVSGNVLKGGGFSGVVVYSTGGGSLITGNQFVDVPQNGVVIQPGAANVEVRDNVFHATPGGGMGTGVVEVSGGGPTTCVNNKTINLSGSDYVLTHANSTLIGEAGGGYRIDSSVVNIKNLPTVDPHVVGNLWSNSGVITVSAG